MGLILYRAIYPADSCFEFDFLKIVRGGRTQSGKILDNEDYPTLTGR